MDKLTTFQEKILDFVKKNPHTQSSDIASFFSVDKRTISRNIKFLKEKNLISITGQGRSLSYFISDFNRILEKIDVEKYFAEDFTKREIKQKFNFDIFSLLENDLFSQKEVDYLNKLHEKFLEDFARYKSQTIINKEFERVMIEFSWKSSEIEGNTYSLLDTEALIKNNIVSPGKKEEDTKMILNHKDAFNEAIQNKEKFTTITLATLEHIHFVLTKDLNINKNLRTGPIGGITGTKYQPLDNKYQVEEATEKTLQLLNSKKSFFEKALLAVLLISYIQPFEDGNKRTARMISNAILLSHGTIPLSYRVIEVEEYKKAILLFDEQNNISYFKEIFINQFTYAVKNYFN